MRTMQGAADCLQGCGNPPGFVSLGEREELSKRGQGTAATCGIGEGHALGRAPGFVFAVLCFSYSWPACSISTKREGEHQCWSSLTTEYWGLQMATLPWLRVSLRLCPQWVIICIGNNYFCSRSIRNRGERGKGRILKAWFRLIFFFAGRSLW